MTLIDRLREAASECGMSGQITSQRDIHLAADALEACLNALRQNSVSQLDGDELFDGCFCCGYPTIYSAEPDNRMNHDKQCPVLVAMKAIEGGG